jgi:cytochrome P450/nitrite reductase/ring-hydroxylating ferredoxin subunit
MRAAIGARRIRGAEPRQLKDIARTSAGWTCVARSEDVRRNRPYPASAEGVDLVLVRTDRALHAFEGRCPHQGALLGEGELEGSRLVCRNHRWRFSVDDGRHDGGPECLRRFSVTEHDGQILVDLRSSHTTGTARQTGCRRISDLPGPPSLPILGNLLQLDMPRLHEVMEGWAAEYGSIFRYRQGVKSVVVVSEPRLNEQVLRARPGVYRRLRTIEPVFREMGIAGVFSAEGSAWLPQRRLTMEALSPRHLRGFYPTLKTVATRLENRWANSARSGAAIDIVEDLKRFTVDVTTLVTLGHDVNTIEQQGEDVIQRLLEQVFPAFNRRLFAIAPTWRVIRTRADRRLDRALAELRVRLSTLIARARDEANPAGSEPSTFLEAMLAARDEAGRPFSDETIFGNLMTMLLAGEDTTAYTLAWAVHHLCDCPTAVDALRHELDRALGPSPIPEDFDTAAGLLYAAAVANETMRLRPVAPLLFHETNVETFLDDLRIPAYTTVGVLTRPAATSAIYFDRPGEFRPERWLSASGGRHEHSVHLPFGSGPRLCPGRTLASLELKVLLAVLYKNFDVERRGRADAVRERFAFTMSPAGLSLELRKRAERPSQGWRSDSAD